MTDFSIREARPGDFDDIIRLWESIDHHASLPDRLEHLKAFHAFTPDLFILAEAEGHIIGTVIGGWDGWRAQIYRLATHPDFRRGGVAGALVDEVERRLQAKGARRIYALVDRRSPPAVPFWEAMGYGLNEHLALYARNFGQQGK
jgi:ribosomal protein S18 acetylase RimI-like enzyme